MCTHRSLQGTKRFSDPMNVLLDISDINSKWIGRQIQQRRLGCLCGATTSAAWTHKNLLLCLQRRGQH
jgi:hypothetical protein